MAGDDSASSRRPLADRRRGLPDAGCHRFLAGASLAPHGDSLDQRTGTSAVACVAPRRAPEDRGRTARCRHGPDSLRRAEASDHAAGDESRLGRGVDRTLAQARARAHRTLGPADELPVEDHLRGYWFHPLVWAAWRRLRLEAEKACDDAVVLEDDARDYASLLVSMAQPAAGGRRPLLPWPAVTISPRVSRRCWIMARDVGLSAAAGPPD